MKKFLATACLTAVALFGLGQVSEANGLFRRCRGCDSGCGSAAPCAPAQPAPIKYEERKVTRYKQVMVDKMVEVLECKRTTREEKYTYTVCVPVTKQEKRTVVYCSTVSKEVDHVYTVMVPKTVQKEVMCTTYQCVREMVTEKVPVCRTVRVQCVDECGRCFTRRERVTCIEERTRCVVKRIPTTTKQMVNVTICEQQQMKCKRTVCEIVRTPKDVMVNVCTIEHQKREGVRTICEYKTEKVKRKVQVCELQPYTETVRVAVCDSCSTTCCSSSGRAGLFSGGLFRRSSNCGGCRSGCN